MAAVLSGQVSGIYCCYVVVAVTVYSLDSGCLALCRWREIDLANTRFPYIFMYICKFVCVKFTFSHCCFNKLLPSTKLLPFFS